jgi:cell division protein FtsI/penicillin-binding protein 2
VVVLDPATGQVLALANRPTTDANGYSRSRPEERVNRAVMHQYEPGSTFKIVPMAAALEAGLVRPDQQFDCENGRWTYRGRTIIDSLPHGILTAREVLERSSNIGMVKIGMGLEPRSLHDAILRFGFAARTGIELPGEAAGSLSPLRKWSQQTQPSLAFGYEIDVSVLQMASAVAAVANGGVLVPPRLVLGLRDADGRVHAFPPPPGTRVISRETNRELIRMLEGVIAEGTGQRAHIEGYTLAGKSGTAKKVAGRGYSAGDYVASFGGFGPVAAPRLVTFVAIDTPRGDEYYGGQVAAPVFQRIMVQALSYLRVPADGDGLALRDVASASPDGRVLR